MRRVEPGYLQFNKTRLSEHFILGTKLCARFPMQACGSIFVSHECQVSSGFHGNKSSKQPGVHAHVRVRYTETSGVQKLSIQTGRKAWPQRLLQCPLVHQNLDESEGYQVSLVYLYSLALMCLIWLYSTGLIHQTNSPVACSGRMCYNQSQPQNTSCLELLSQHLNQFRKDSSPSAKKKALFFTQ